jgi:hypothetical protein
MDTNKPEQTPSLEETPEAPEQEQVEIQLPDNARKGVEERVSEAIAKQKAPDEPVEAQPQQESSLASKPSENGPVADVSQKGDSSPTDPNKEVLEKMGEITGRKYGSIEDALSHVDNLNRFVGDNEIADLRKDSKVFKQFVGALAQEEGVTPEEALVAINNVLNETEKITAPTAQPQEEIAPQDLLSKKIEKMEPARTPDKELLSRIERVEDATQREALRRLYPGSQEYEDDIAALAKQRGISYVEAYEKTFKDLVDAKKTEESRKTPVVKPSNTVGFDQKKAQKLASKVLQGNSVDDKEKLVAEVLGL